MNENLTDNTNNDILNEEELQPMEGTEDVGEGTEVEGTTEENGNGELGSVPGGDSVDNNLNEELLQELLAEVGEIKAILPELVEYEEKENMMLWEKPLSDYTVVEGISLITMFMLLGVIIFVMVGRIVKCKI